MADAQISTPPPLPPVAVVGDEVLITGERSKLPPNIAAIVDPNGNRSAGELPPGVQFFEKQITSAGLIGKLAWAAGLTLFGLVCVIYGVDVIIHPIGPVTVYSKTEWMPLGFGLICWLGAWLMVSSWLSSLKLRDAQRAGIRTTVGIFITADYLIESTDSTWCIIPRAAFRGIEGQTVRYDVKGQMKSITLPGELVAATPSQMQQAISAWAAKH